jgi:site-specific recombinase XerD
MEKTLSILFYLKKGKNKNALEIPIYMRITVDGKRNEISTKRKIEPKLWNPEAMAMKGNSEDARILNNYLDNLKNKVYKQYNFMDQDEMDISSQEIKAKLTGTSISKHYLVELIEYHNNQVKERVGHDFAAGTHKRYKVLINKVKNFLKEKYKTSDIEINKLNHEFVTNFDFYLRTHDKLNHNTTIKYHKCLKKIIRIALANEWLLKNPYENFKTGYKDTNRGYLTMEEIKRLEDKYFDIKRLEVVRDIFVFQIYTGLAYSDVSKLKKEDISIGIDGNQWITIYRSKTNTRTSLPLLPKALEIIEKYRNNLEAEIKGTVFPISSNQKMNAYLKEIAVLCKINKHLTTHLARHTFATTVTLTNGVPIESVSAMLGHKSLKTTQIYSKIVDSKVSEDMSNLSLRISNKSKDISNASSG